MGVDLTTLSTDEKRELYEQLSFELRGQKVDQHVFLLWNDIHDILQLGKQGRQPLDRYLAIAGNRGTLEQAADTFEALIMRVAPARTMRTQVIQLRALLLDCLLRYIRARSLPERPDVLIRNMGSLRTAVDRAFPGYIEAGLLHRVVNVRQSNA